LAYVKPDIPPEAQKFLARLDKAGAQCEQLEAALASARELRDDLARDAADAGASYRDIAPRARLSVPRVQQLVADETAA
jgi:hypothetical protein